MFCFSSFSVFESSQPRRIVGMGRNSVMAAMQFVQTGHAVPRGIWRKLNSGERMMMRIKLAAVREGLQADARPALPSYLVDSAIRRREKKMGRAVEGAVTVAKYQADPRFGALQGRMANVYGVADAVYADRFNAANLPNLAQLAGDG
jgi:hypothetical protein